MSVRSVPFRYETYRPIFTSEDGPPVSIKALFKPGPPLTLIPGRVLGQGQWSFEGASQALILKYQGEPQGTFPRTVKSRTGGTLHNQYPLPDHVLRWPAPRAVPAARTVHLNPCEARLMTLAIHRAQSQWATTPSLLAAPNDGAQYESEQSMAWKECVEHLPIRPQQVLRVYSARHDLNTGPEGDDPRLGLASPHTTTDHTIAPTQSLLALEISAPPQSVFAEGMTDQENAQIPHLERPGTPQAAKQEQEASLESSHMASGISDSEGRSHQVINYAADIVAATSVWAQCSQQQNKLTTEPYFIEARGSTASFHTGGRETHFMGIAHDDDGQPLWTEEHEPVMGVIATAWNTCIPAILGLCTKGRLDCDQYHVEVGDLGAVMSQLPLAKPPYERLGMCKKSIMQQPRFKKGSLFTYNPKQMATASAKVNEARERQQQETDQNQALLQLRAQATALERRQLVQTEPKIKPALAPAAAKPRGDKEKAGQRAKVARAKRKKEKDEQSGSSARRAAPVADSEEEKQLAHGQPPNHKRMRLTSKQLKRQKLQAELDALDAEEEPSAQPDRYRSRHPPRYSSGDDQDWRYGRYPERAPYHHRGPGMDYEGYGPAPGAPEYPHYGPWSGMTGHHAPRRQPEMHQAPNRYPHPGGMGPYHQPRQAHDPYGPGPMASRPRLQVKKRSAGGPSQDDMDDRSDNNDSAVYEGEGDDDEDDYQDEA